MAEWLAQSRTLEGREQLRQSGQLQLLISEYFSSLPGTRDDWRRRQQLMQCFKNCLISSEGNALYFEEQRFLPEAIRHLDMIGDIKERDETTLSYTITTLQFIANFVTSHEICAESFWEDVCGVEGISKLLSLAISLTSDSALSAVIAILHSCLSKDKPTYRTRRQQVLEGRSPLCTGSHCVIERQLCCQLALSLMDLQYSLSVSKDSLATQTMGGIEKSLKWLHIFLLSLCLKGHSADIFRRVGQSSPTSPCDHVALSHEQVIFLNVLTGVFEDSIFTNQTRIQLEATPRETSPSLCALESLTEDLAKLFTTPLLSQIRQAESSSGAPLHYLLLDALALSSVRMAPSLSHALSVPAVPAVLDCLSACILATDEIYEGISLENSQRRETLRIKLSNSSVDDVCLRILAARRRDASTAPSSRASTHRDPTPPSAVAAVDPQEREYWNTVVKACLNLLMNLAHRCPSVQDTIRVREGIPVLLSYCATDFENPLCREFALMCVRNLCEGNLENQRFIESLKPQQILQDDSLLAKGIRVEMDPSSGRFQFHHSPTHTDPQDKESRGVGQQNEELH